MRRPDRVTRSPLVRAIAEPVEAVDGALNRAATGVAGRVLPFYRRWPYGGRLGFFTADMRGAYSPEDLFFYNRIPKAANSTVMATLADASSFRQRLARDRAKSRFLRPSRLGAREVERLDAEAFRFVFVRDPYARALSAFADKVLRKRQQARPFYAWLGRTDGPAPEFVEFLRFLEDGGAMSDPHWAPQTDLLLMPFGDFHFVGRVERLGLDLATVVARLFGPEASVKPRRAGPRTNSSDRIGEVYGPEAIGIVNRVFAADFEMFGYPKRPA
jgi:hypothetical protein